METIENKGKGQKNNNPKPNKTEGEGKTMKYTNHAVKEIEKLVAAGWELDKEDKEILPTLKHTPLADLLATDEGKKTLARMQNTITLRHKTEKTKSGNKATKNIHLWENEDWMSVLEPAGKMVSVKKPNQKKAEWMLLAEVPVEDMEWICRTPQGGIREDIGYKLPKIGGYNFTTGDIEHTNETMVVNRIELFHKWHDVKRSSTKATSTNSALVEHCLVEAKRAEEKGNTELANEWKAKAEHFKGLNK